MLNRIRVLLAILSFTCFGSATSAFASQVYVFAGATPVGTPAPATTVTVTLDKAGLAAGVGTLTTGLPNLDFTDAGGGTCAAGATYTAGQTCTVTVQFTPAYPGGRSGAVVVTDAGNNVLGTTYLYGLATGGAGVFFPTNILTLAGDYGFFFNGDGGLATNASLKLPTGVAVDAVGNVFIADTGNDRVRRVDAATLKISTIAGDGATGYKSDGIQAIANGLSSPAALVLDGAGNLYISDSGNNAVRSINLATGIITTIAGNGNQAYTGDGGLALNASLNAPEGLALDQRGSLYIADTGNNVIRKVDLLTGTISTAAGNGRGGFSGDGLRATIASLNAPWSVACSSGGLLYITDTNDNRVRYVDATGLIHTVAGTGHQAYSGDGGAATAATLALPSGIALDAADNIYISDTANGHIRKVSSTTGDISSIAGTGSQGFNGDNMYATMAGIFAPYSLAIDQRGNLLLADTFHNRIRTLTASAVLIVHPGAMTQVGQTTPVTVQRFENDGNAPLTISSITPAPDASVDAATTTCSPSAPLSTGATCNVGVTATPTVAGPAVLGKVNIASDAANQPGVITISVNAVQPAATTTTLTSSSNPSSFGQTVIFLASVTGKNGPTGTVTFLDGTTVLGTGALNPGGEALFSISTLTIGPHAITASYGGDVGDLSSVSAVLTQVVVEPTSVTVVSSLNPSLPGQAVTFTATVKGATSTAPTGIVSFTDGGVTIGTGTLNANGVATFQTSTLAPGQHTIEAVYPGDKNTAPGTSLAITQTVLSTATNVNLLVSATSLNVGQPLTLTAVVTNQQSTPPTGTVTFLNGATALGTATLNGKGVGVFTFTPAAGTYNITASYGGDTDDAGSVSSGTTVTVVYAPDFTVSAAPTSLNIVSGKSATITVTLTSDHGFADKIALGCAAQPALSNCTFSQDTVVLAAGGTTTVQLTFNTFPLNLSLLDRPSPGHAKPGHANEIRGISGSSELASAARHLPASRLKLALALPGGILLVLFPSMRRRRWRGWQLLVLFVLTSTGAGLLNGCGGTTVNTTAAGSYSVLIDAVGTTTADTHSTPLQVTVTR